MAKNLKLKIKNSQLAKAAGLDKLKAKLAGKTDSSKKEDSFKDAVIIEKSEVKPKTHSKLKASSTSISLSSSTPSSLEEGPNILQRRIRAKSRSSFASDEKEMVSTSPIEEEPISNSDLEKEANGSLSVNLDQKEEKIKSENLQIENIFTDIEEQNKNQTEKIFQKDSFSQKKIDLEVGQEEEVQTKSTFYAAPKEKFDFVWGGGR